MKEVTVTADSRLEAILRVRRELGTDAKIVSERKTAAPGIPGILGKKVYEVVAAREGTEAGPVPEPALDPDVLRQELDDLREMVFDLRSQHALVMAPPSGEQLARAWRAFGVDVDDLGAVGEDQRGPKAELLCALLPTAPALVATEDRQVVALVGPVGSGKSSVARRLAGKFEPGEAVTMDFGQDVRLPDAKIVIIDTPPLNGMSGVAFEEMRLALEEIGARVWPTLSGAAKPKDLLAILERMAPLAPERIVFTQLDVTRDWSGPLVVGTRYGIPIAYISRGSGAEDLLPAEGMNLVSDVPVS